MFSYLEGDEVNKYLQFLQEHFFDCKPIFLSVVRATRKDDNTVIAVLRDDIANPEHDIIGICHINGKMMGLWNEKFWIVDKSSVSEVTLHYVGEHVSSE